MVKLGDGVYPQHGEHSTVPLVIFGFIIKGLKELFASSTMEGLQ
jgi:hypothetical protein